MFDDITRCFRRLQYAEVHHVGNSDRGLLTNSCWELCDRIFSHQCGDRLPIELTLPIIDAIDKMHDRTLEKALDMQRQVTSRGCLRLLQARLDKSYNFKGWRGAMFAKASQLDCWIPRNPITVHRVWVNLYIVFLGFVEFRGQPDHTLRGFGVRFQEGNFPTYRKSRMFRLVCRFFPEWRENPLECKKTIKVSRFFTAFCAKVQKNHWNVKKI